MPKRYHSDLKKMMHESSQLIHENHGAPCNLPTDIISKDFPASHYGMGGGIGNLFTGVQKQMKTDYGDFHREMDPKKY